MADSLWLLDTSVLIDVLRGHKPAQLWVDSLAPVTPFISVITAAELVAGCRNATEQRLVERELELYETLWLDEALSQTALHWYQRFRLSHNTGFLDCLIAATATQRRLTLATLNLKHFSPLPDLLATKPY